MAFYVKTKKGHTIVLRNPSEKAKRYARQLKNGVVAETGKKLSPTDRAHHIGYLQARSDNAKAYKSNQLRKHSMKKSNVKRASMKSRY